MNFRKVSNTSACHWSTPKGPEGMDLVRLFFWLGSKWKLGLFSLWKTPTLVWNVLQKEVSANNLPWATCAYVDEPKKAKKNVIFYLVSLNSSWGFWISLSFIFSPLWSIHLKVGHPATILNHTSLLDTVFHQNIPSVHWNFSWLNEWG